MNLYRFYFVDAAGGIAHRHPLQLPTKAAAVRVGQHMLAKRGRDRGLEIWHHDCLVHHQRETGG
jgi:hypothetical protein